MIDQRMRIVFLQLATDITHVQLPLPGKQMNIINFAREKQLAPVAEYTFAVSVFQSYSFSICSLASLRFSLALMSSDDESIGEFTLPVSTKRSGRSSRPSAKLRDPCNAVREKPVLDTNRKQCVFVCVSTPRHFERFLLQCVYQNFISTSSQQ